MKKDKNIEVDKKELWEQIKKDARGSCYSVKFEVVDVNDDVHQIACFVDEELPLVTSNFQHAGLISGIIQYLDRYLKNIETAEDFKSKYVVIGAFTEELAKLSVTLGKCLEKHMKEIKDDKESEDSEADD